MTSLWAFDFDGTLVATADLKRAAFFEVFPACYASVVESALARWPDASRHEVIPRMVDAAEDPALDSISLIAAYGETVAVRVRQAPTTDGAEEALAWAASVGVVCLFSATPHAELISTVQMRDWGHWLSDVRGYPARKSDTLATWIKRFGAHTTTVIGDGASDAEAARNNNAQFLRADPGWPQRLMARVPT